MILEARFVFEFEGLVRDLDRRVLMVDFRGDREVLESFNSTSRSRLLLFLDFDPRRDAFGADRSLRQDFLSSLISPLSFEPGASSEI